MHQHTPWMTQAITDLEHAGLSQVQGTPLAALSQYDAQPGLGTRDCVRVLAFSRVTDTCITIVQFWAHKGASIVDVHVSRFGHTLTFDRNGQLEQETSYFPNLLPFAAWTIGKSILTPEPPIAYN